MAFLYGPPISFSAEFRNLFHAGGIHRAKLLLSFCFFFLLTLLSTTTKLPEVTHLLLYFDVCWKHSKLANLELELGKHKQLSHDYTLRKVKFLSYF
jgi:hypothetical protein